MAGAAWISGAPSPAEPERRAGLRRSGVGAAAEVRLAAGLREPAARVDARFVDARRVVAAARLVEPAVRRVVEPPREETLWATCWTCLLMPSRRLSALSMSACLAARWTCAWTCLIAVFRVFSLSLILRSSWRRRSLGTRLSASRSAVRPALTARPTMLPGRRARLDRAAARFLVAMLQPPITTPRGAFNAPH